MAEVRKAEGDGVPQGGDGPGSGPPPKVGTGGIVVMTVLGTVAGLFWGPFLGLGYGALVAPAKGYTCLGVIPDENWIRRGGFLGLFAGPLAMGFLFHWMAVRGAREARDPGAPPGWLRRYILPPMKAPRFLQLGLFVVTLGACAGMVFPSTLGARAPSPNETAAMATLRNLTSAQAMAQGGGKIDCDGDKIGEFGTFLELTGFVPVRNGFFPGDPSGADFSGKGEVVKPSVLTAALANVNERGIVTKAGYCFIIYLPSDSKVAGFVHETGPAATPGLTGRVGVDVSETTWCAYAWPAVRGNTGNRCFFVNQAGDVMQSANEVAQWSGPGKAPPGNSAFRANGITAQVAVGTRGMDGDVWKITN
jgi:hypothetical protein